MESEGRKKNRHIDYMNGRTPEGKTKLKIKKSLTKNYAFINNSVSITEPG